MAIPPTESYMDQGNWALARHYANQAKLALDEQLSPAAVGPLINGRYQAFLQMARNDPNAIITLDQLIQTQTEGTEPFETMLVRTLIYQRQYDRAMDLVEAILAKPSSFDPATVLFYPPFDQLHRHPRFREVMRPYASADQIDHAIDWVSQQ